MKKLLTHITDYNLSLTIIFAAGCICMWLPDFIRQPLTGIEIWTLSGTALLMLTNALLLMAAVWQTGITRTRSVLPIILYCFSISSIPSLHTDWQSQIAVSAFQLTLLLVLQTYHQDHAVEESFLCTLLLCMGALVMPDLLCMIPVVWLLFITQRALNFRSFLASLTGACTVGIYAGIAHALGWIRIGTPAELFSRSDVTCLPVSQQIALYVLLAETLFILICTLLRFPRENHHIQSYITCIAIPFIPAGTLMFLPPWHFPSLLPISVLLLAGICTWFFYSRKSVFAGIVFIIHTLIWTAVRLFC